MENNIQYYIKEVKRKDTIGLSTACIEGIVRGLIRYGETLSTKSPIEAVVSVGLGHDVVTGDVCQNFEEHRNAIADVIIDIINNDEETVTHFKELNPDFTEVTHNSGKVMFMWFYAMFQCGFYSEITEEDLEGLPEKAITRTPNKITKVDGVYMITGLLEHVVLGDLSGESIPTEVNFPLIVGYLYSQPTKVYYTDELFEQTIQPNTPLEGISEMYASRLLCGVDIRNNCVTEDFYATYDEVAAGIELSKETVLKVMASLVDDSDDGDNLWRAIDEKVMTEFANMSQDESGAALPKSVIAIAKRVFTLYLQDTSFDLNRFRTDGAGMDDLTISEIAVQNANYSEWVEFRNGNNEQLHTATRGDSKMLYFNRVTVTGHAGPVEKLLFIKGVNSLLADGDATYKLPFDDGVIGSEEITTIEVDTHLNAAAK